MNFLLANTTVGDGIDKKKSPLTMEIQNSPNQNEH